jgi:spermidine synthase
MLVAVFLMVLSGAAALGYQIVWTQQGALWLGHEGAAVLAVVAAFFGGLALGALVLGSRIERSARPARWYAACEALIGVWSLTLLWLAPRATDVLVHLIGLDASAPRHWAVAFFGTFLLLLPATAAMGATLPAMERVLAGIRTDQRSLAMLYAANTFGAVVGVLAAAFVLVPILGLRRTSIVCAVANFACAIGVLAFARDALRHEVPRIVAAPRGTLALLATTGLLGIGYEVLTIRVLSQVAENTVYTFAILLTVYLVGTAIGAAIYSRWLAMRGDAVELRDRLLRALACVCLVGTLCLAGATTIKNVTLASLGSTFGAALTAEVVLAIGAFLLPTLVMGALFSHLSTQARASGVDFGRALGVNTLGAAFAPALFGVVLLPAIGAKVALLIIVLGYLALSTRRAWLAPTQWIATAAVVTLAVFGPALAIITVPYGGRLVSYTEGASAAVSIVEDASGVASLHIDNRQQEGSSATYYVDARQALLPILLHPAPHRALFLGLGTGVTAAAAAQEPTLSVDAVELLPEVIAASDYFRRGIDDGARLHLLNADARRYARVATTQYDVIVADNFHPARSGSGTLYTVEHFAAIRERLASDGVFCQWLPLHQLDLDTFRSITRSFIEIYPHGWAILATNSLETPVIGLVARNGPGGFDLGSVRNRVQQRSTAVGFDSDLALLGSFIAGPEALTGFAGNAPLNTDDHPIVAYRAPRITYAPDSLPRDRLLALLHELRVTPNEVLLSTNDAWAARLTAYWHARDRFIEVGRDVKPTNDVRSMLAQVQDPLLSVLRISADFKPAYEPLARMATALAPIDADASHALEAELRSLRPE